MRVAYFNELDSFASCHHLDSKQLIDGICADPRIGDGYNNPSFGFGGYCLPKDTLQLSSSFNNVPNAIIKSLKKSNQLRKKHVVDDILKSRVKHIGIYLLSMKKDSDNFRESSIIDVIKLLKKNGKTIYIYEPLLGKKKNIFGCTVINDFNSFLNKTGLIVTNRLCKELRKVRNKVYTRDIYGEN
jgi:UDPglucose 6-dehydrogenase